jgi:hypothetical protein
MAEKSNLDDWKKVKEIIGLLTGIVGPALALWLGWIPTPLADVITFQKEVLVFFWITLVGFLFIFVKIDKLGKKENV